MDKIKRYDINWRYETIDERPQGTWVKWDDVKGYVLAIEQVASELDLEELKSLLDARPREEGSAE